MDEGMFVGVSGSKAGVERDSCPKAQKGDFHSARRGGGAFDRREKELAWSVLSAAKRGEGFLRAFRGREKLA